MSSTATAWFAIKVRSRHERVVSEVLKSKGYEAYLPLYLRSAGSRKRSAEINAAPLFPSYLFCRFNPGIRLPILSTTGVVQVVSCGRVPAEIDEQEIESIRRLASSGMELSPCPYIAVGEEVTIVGGPLNGVGGLMVKHKTGARVVISIDIIQRSVVLEVDLHRITPRIATAKLQLAS